MCNTGLKHLLLMQTENKQLLTTKSASFSSALDCLFGFSLSGTQCSTHHLSLFGDTPVNDWFDFMLSPYGGSPPLGSMPELGLQFGIFYCLYGLYFFWHFWCFFFRLSAYFCNFLLFGFLCCEASPSLIMILFFVLLF